MQGLVPTIGMDATVRNRRSEVSLVRPSQTYTEGVLHLIDIELALFRGTDKNDFIDSRIERGNAFYRRGMH